MAGHTIQVSVLADTKPLKSAFNNLGNQLGLDKLGGALKTIAIGVGTAATAVAGAGSLVIGQGIKDAANLEQSIGAVDAIFKGSADQMHAWAKSAAQSVGLSRNEFNELGTIIGAQLKNGGTAMDELAPKTNQLITLGADLSSMFGGSTREAVEALSSALKGERDPIERYGVTLKQATIDAKAAELGFTKVGNSFSAEAQQAATLALIMEQTTDAHGNFGKESDTLQGKQQRLGAAIENISARIGTLFLPAATAIAEVIATEVMPRVEEAAGWLENNLGPVIQQVAAWISTEAVPAFQQLVEWAGTNLLPPLQQLGNFILNQLFPTLVSIGQWMIDAQGWLLPIAVGIGAIVAAMQAWNIITGIVTVAQALLNAVQAANPMGAIVLAIIGLIATLVYLWNTNDGFRNALIGAWNAIVDACKALGRWFSDVFSAAGRLISDFVNGAKQRFNDVVNAVRNLASGVGERINSVVQFFTDLPGKISNALSGIGSRLAEIGRNMISSLANALSPRAIIDKIKGVIGDAIGFAKRLLGIASPSRVFRDIGRHTIAGLAQGITAARGLAINAMHLVGDNLITAAPTLTATATSGSTGGGIVINVQTLQPSYETGRVIANLVEDTFRRRGSI